MNEEIESLYALLGVKPDEASVSDSVDKLVKAVQSKLKSSIYGGKDGVITLPATIDGKFKNGKEINQEIKDAYAAIYKKAQQMADESVSLTLKDIKDFKTQIDKFGKKTAKYKGSDIIANANNNLRQMLSDYQDFVNDLRKQVNTQQKAQIKQTQKVKAQQKAKTKKSYHGITDEEIESNIQSERRRRLSGIKQAEPKGYKRYVGFEGGVATDKTLKASDRGGPYPSNYARQMKLSELAAVKWMKKSLKTYLSENIANDYAKAFTNGIPIKRQIQEKKKNGQIETRYEDDVYYGKNKNNISDKQKADETANLISNELAKILGGLEANRPDASIDQFNKYLEATLQSEKNGKGGYDAILLALNKTFHRYFNTDGTIGITDGGKTGAGEGHRQAQRAIIGMIKTFKEKLETGFADKVVKVGEQLVNVSAEELRQLKVLARIDPRAASKEVDRILNGTNVSSTKQGSGSKLDQEVNRLVRESKNTTNAVKAGTKATNVQTVYDKNANVKSDTDMAKEIKVEEVNRDINKDTARAVKADEVSGFNTDTTANKLIGIVEDIRNNLGKAKDITSKIELPISTKDLYKKLADPSKILGLPKPDGRRKKISDGLKDENPQLGLIPVQNAMKKALAVIPGEFAKTLKEAIHPSVLDKQRHIDRPEGTDKFEYDEDMLRRLANASNARKEARRNQNGDITAPPRVVIPDYQPQVEKSKIYASPIKQTVWDKLADALGDLTGATKAYKDVMNAAAEDQDKMAAERIVQYGMNNGRNPNDTGDIAGMRRILQLYRTNKASIEQNPELRQKIRLTGGRDVDTTAITKALNKVLSGKQMRNAQMGGSPLRQVAGAFTGFIGMPSLEKSRAQADGLNQILGNINNALNSVLANIQMKETELAGLEKEGKAKFNADGTLTEDSSSAAFKTLADLEEEKLVLDTIKADLLANDEIIARTGGKFSKLVRQLSFTSPVLRDNNSILRNINAGLDKNGKALKFQTRMAEILNYTFQLISRSIGQWFKKIISMLNPLNIIKSVFKTITGWIKSAFQDFGSYDTKWQRTMNVIKINFQRAIKPAMEWIAQKLVNIIGFFNIISMKVQEAFGQTPVDLFDQAGANAEKMRRELEKAANVTAGFDELHDIGSDNSGENDLLGDIYKPQLSDEWKAMAEEIGDLFAGLIKGEKTIGEVFGRIFGMLLELLGKIAKAIWDWFKQTSLGKWLIANWKKILASILTAFLAWKLLKIAGPTLLKALWGWITNGKIGEIFGKLGTKFMDVFTSTQFGSDFVRGIKAMFNSGGMIGTFKAGGASLGAVFAQALVAVIGVAIAGFSIAKGFDIVADDESYNLGYEAYGGTKDKDKKSGAGGKALGTLGGAAGGALAGLAIGGPIGAAIGAAIGGIAGLITTSLAPAFEKLEVAARNANNEMQKIEYYEGAVKGAQSQVDIFDEQQQLLKQSLELSTKAVYEQGEKLGISKSRMDELVQATQNGTFTTDMLTGSETGLAGSLTDLAQKQEHTTEVTKKLEEAQKKLLKAQTELSIAQDIEAGNFEIAAARIEVAEAQGVYSTEDATKKRIQLYKQGGEEERKNLLQNLTQDQRQKMAEYNAVTDKELQELSKIWQESSDDVKKSLLEGVGADTQQKFQQEMNSIDAIIQQHQGFWQGVGDTIAEIFSFGNAKTWTYNGEAKYEEEAKKGKFTVRTYAVGTNYVPNDGLAYLHQGEAVIPKKYNQPYQPQNNSGMESAINNLVQQVAQISNQVNQGIPVKGQFVQRGSDLVATVERANNRIKNNVLNNRVYAR